MKANTEGTTPEQGERRIRVPLLDRIAGPEDLRSLSNPELRRLASEIRREIIEVVSRNGGHLASNLGIVELTIALHRVFVSPKDKIIWDVGHQSYVHKLITGRRDSFHTIRMKGGISGFPKRSESPHDIVETGHASTSISAGLGILVGQQLQGVEGKVVVVIGDGALTGGMAFEALNHTGHLRKNLIIVLNDNNMAISPNVGAISRDSAERIFSTYLSRITATKFYQNLRDRIDRGILVVPAFGYRLMELVVRLKKGIKAIFFKETLFSEFGFEYVGPIDGHNLHHLDQVFRAVRKLKRRVVVHVVTRKGKGFPQAEGNPTLYHGVSPLSLVDGKIEKKAVLSYTEVFSSALLSAAEQHSRIVAITAAMADGTGLVPFQNKYPSRFFDVGIAEQHAVTFAAGLAAAGMKPVVPLYSTFVQRAVDQVIHDIALPGLPVVVAMDRAGLVGNDGETHQGLYDIPIFRAVPGMTILAPSGEAELRNMLSYALDLGKPVLIRYPKAPCLAVPDAPSDPIREGRGAFCRLSGEDLLIVAVGSLLPDALEAHVLLWKEGIPSDLYDLRFIKPIDEAELAAILSAYRFVVVVEDGAVIGGAGESIAALATRNRLRTRVATLGVRDNFIPHASRPELIAECGLDAVGIAGSARALLSERFLAESRKAVRG